MMITFPTDWLFIEPLIVGESVTSVSYPIHNSGKWLVIITLLKNLRIQKITDRVQWDTHYTHPLTPPVYPPVKPRTRLKMRINRFNKNKMKRSRPRSLKAEELKLFVTGCIFVNTNTSLIKMTGDWMVRMHNQMEVLYLPFLPFVPWKTMKSLWVLDRNHQKGS